jgi:hypothetical protein
MAIPAMFDDGKLPISNIAEEVSLGVQQVKGIIKRRDQLLPGGS